MKNKKYNLFVLIYTISLFFTVTIMASQISDLEGQQSDIESDIDRQQELLDETNRQLEATEGEIAELDFALDEARSKLLDISSQVEEANSNLEQTKIELEEIQNEYDIKYEKFKERLRVMYEFGNIGYIEVLVGSESVADFFNRLEYVNSIANHDKEIMDKLLVLENEIQDKLIEVEEYKMTVDKLLVEQTRVTSELNTKRANKESLMTNLENNAAEYERTMNELEESSKEIEAMIKQMQAQSTSKVYYTGGILGWPVPSCYTLNSNYGSRIHPITGVETFHHGVDIPGSYGEQVVAAESGVVITSDYVSGYGYTIIIDHGDGLSTLYGHNSSLSVSVGQEVVKGQEISLIGSTGNSTGPHCHFEVRINGSSTDPAPYLGQ
ncbi:MAG: murein hydrolase activator EnvC family protein [Lachnospirales bacterium]